MHIAQPTVSVIVPTYNGEAYIVQTITSVLQQSGVDFELLVIDDGSTDTTRDLVRSFGKSVSLITQENRGVCAARNNGIAEAKGRYIAFLDQDDYWLPGKLATQVNALANNGQYGVVCTSFIRWESDPAGHFPMPDSYNVSATPGGVDNTRSGWVYQHFLLDCWMLTSTVLIRSEALRASGGFDVSLPYGEDWDLWLRLSREQQFCCLSRPSVLYRQHPGQGSREPREQDYRTTLLRRAEARWGLCGPDGACVKRKTFRMQLAAYDIQYGYACAKAREPMGAVRALLRGWRGWREQYRLMAYTVAVLMGVTPRW